MSATKLNIINSDSSALQINNISINDISLGSGGGNVIINNDISINGSIQTSTIIDITSTNAFLVRKNGNSGNVFNIDTTNSVISIAKDLSVGGSAIFTGDATSNDLLTIRPTGGYGAHIQLDASTSLSGKNYRIFSSGSTASEGNNKLIIQNVTDSTVPLQIVSDNLMIGHIPAASSAGYKLDVLGTSRISGITTLTSNTSSSNTTTGTLIVTGGVGISGNLNIGGGISLNSVLITPNSEDIETEIIFNGVNNQVIPADITGLTFSNGVTGSFIVQMYVKIIATTSLYAQVHLEGVQDSSGWYFIQNFVGSDPKLFFNITSSGQIQYTSSNYIGFSSMSMKFKARSISV